MHASEPSPQDLHGVLEQFGRDANQIVESFLSDIASREPPPIIYHYTNDSWLKGILETGKIWLSDAFSLNDPSELSHGFSIFLESLRNRAPELHRIAELMLHFLNRISDSAQYFICSFSAAETILASGARMPITDVATPSGSTPKPSRAHLLRKNVVRCRTAPHSQLHTMTPDWLTYIVRSSINYNCCGPE